MAAEQIERPDDSMTAETILVVHADDFEDATTDERIGWFGADAAPNALE
jgi:hypothetical protein